MKKINLRGLSDILNGKELRNVVGGSAGSGGEPCKYNYCYDCHGYKDRKGVICSSNSMDWIYNAFNIVCTSGGMLWSCSNTCDCSY